MTGNVNYLFSNIGKIEKILSGKFIYLFIDYDGTLAPIARTPGKAKMAVKTKALLSRMSRMPDCKIAIISGRSLKDVSRRVGLRNIVYAGNHGHEIKGSKISFKSSLPIGYKKTLKEIKIKLKEAISYFRHVLIEDKGLSLSVHYRLVSKKSVPMLKSAFNAVLLGYELSNKVHVNQGKMILEVLPPISWNKGKAVLRLLKYCKFAMRDRRVEVLPICIGDDRTDEDVFEALRGRGITVFVGKPKNTGARFYLKDTKDVSKFLKIISEKID